MFNLLFIVTCAGLSYPSKSIFICGGDVQSIRFHIPTEQRGSARIIDQEIDYGIFDFNTVYTEKGWWLFKRKFLPMSDTPIIDVSKGNVPINIGVFSEKSGKQFGVVDSFKMKDNSNDFKVEYTCSGRKFVVGEKSDWSYGQFVGGCVGLVDSTLSFSVTHDTTMTRISLAGCGYDKTINDVGVINSTFSLKVKPDICSLYIQTENKIYRQRIKMMILGKPRDELNIDKPIILNDKAFKPNTSTILTGEHYLKGKIVKRFYTEANDYDISWFREGDLCLFAHSSLGQSSEICYNWQRDELPMTFFR